MASIDTPAEDSQPKPSIFQSTAIYFDSMTWGNLRQFVAMADLVFVDDSEPVALAWDESDYDDPNSPPIGLKFTGAV